MDKVFRQHLEYAAQAINEGRTSITISQPDNHVLLSPHVIITTGDSKGTYELELGKSVNGYPGAVIATRSNDSTLQRAWASMQSDLALTQQAVTEFVSVHSAPGKKVAVHAAGRDVSASGRRLPVTAARLAAGGGHGHGRESH